jgi:hypothetical protein
MHDVLLRACETRIKYFPRYAPLPCLMPRLQVSKMPKWKVKGVDPETRTAINTEWGCYGSELLPRVKEDLELDAASGPQQGEPQLVRCSVPECLHQ